MRVRIHFQGISGYTINRAQLIYIHESAPLKFVAPAGRHPSAYPESPQSTVHIRDDLESLVDTVCPRSLGPFYTVSYCINWVKTSGTDSITSVISNLV